MIKITLTPMKKHFFKANKYRAQKVEIDGHKFASKKEAKRYLELVILEKAGEINGLILQPMFEMRVNGIKICRYYPDFIYFTKGRQKVIEDVKGIRTPVFKLKKKLFEALGYGKIVEI